MSAECVYILLSVLLAIIDLLLKWIVINSEKTSQNRFVKLLYLDFGPQTDIAFMTRKELFRASLKLFIWSLHFSVITFLSAGIIFMLYMPAEPPIALIAVCCFILPMLIFIFLASAICLFVRALFRKSSYIPPPQPPHPLRSPPRLRASITEVE
jgi:hypothetical protein